MFNTVWESMVDSGRVLLSLLAVTLLCTAPRWKDLLPANKDTHEVIHIALGATLGVIPGMVATMRSVLLNTHSQGERCLLPLSSPSHLKFYSPAPHTKITHKHTQTHNTHTLILVIFHLFVTNVEEVEVLRQMLECVGIGEEYLGTVKVFPPQTYFTAAIAADLTASPNFVRLFLGQELPGAVSKVLWLDSDVIVQKDITELWEMLRVSGDKWTVAAVQLQAKWKDLEFTLGGRTYNNSLRFQSAFQLRYPSRKISEIELSRRAFNAGVLLLNLDHLRANGSYLMEEMLWWSKRNSEQEVLWGGGSQPLANLLALLSPAGDYQHLPATWNVLRGDTLMNDSQEWNSERGILHWTILGDRSKPWRDDLRQQSIGLWLPYGLAVMECYRFLKLPEK